ncbi:transcriptional regulator [Sulfolobus acidocaldarius]|uniref:Transcriptional regulator ArsR family n=4 Tax=Sulfolobus acidocaldarius TaxID=2285 RepID=Q4J9V5_SULAC|nr:transcriptional regulator [Sulfolobus acidocaldarius]AAY80425.1 transcriptional regulator ArsR family [Sulfolobus acidocaldarius DSM 639]AGE71009.1 ArsR family transcriptional regulator [Sulfolobus acidocaldarius N8]AGE73280.1 ArsR family transcriptional regulator [Sulfolobus acidocaldarius Ron12/I]ALU28694.1 ArsR family transcriptional regulator [Sulfolobus acidocaldarius]ALU31412.1 ArsR family transcriptional regulator [Sulfolobus acidocaldarius]
MSDDLKKIIELLNNPVLSNSSRLGILISLYILGKTTFAELQKSTEIPKSSLHMHLQILEENGLVTVKKIPTLSGPRTIVQITEKGVEEIKKYINVIRDIKI